MKKLYLFCLSLCLLNSAYAVPAVVDYVLDGDTFAAGVKIDDDIVAISINFPSHTVEDIKVLGPRYGLNNIPYSNRGWCVLSDLQDTIRELSGNELPIDEESLRKIILNK